MRKRSFEILLAAVLAVNLSACGMGEKEGQDSKIEEKGEESRTSEEEEEDLSETAEDREASASEEQSAQEGMKAAGYDYDRESLTWELVWWDEFDYEGAPDPDKWGYDVGGSGWGNNELQYYTEADNATVKDGCLVIEARKEPMGDREYTSARLVTRGKGDWLYGKVEICAKLPAGLGTWPAAWMLPTDWEYGQWPASGEIDIMEHVGYDQDVIVQSVHNQKFNGGKSKGVSYRLEGVSEDFHVYSLEWLPDKLIFSADGMERYTYDPFKFSKAPTYEQWPFDKRMHILLNLAFGGNWGGAKGTDDSYFPVEYYIDYVRVYQSPEIAQLIEAEENKEADQ
jgi:beta-glucanase (GH16 family)